MFSTSQSKAFFSQEAIKGKLIGEQIIMINHVFDKICQVKANITDAIRFLLQQSNIGSHIDEKIKSANRKIKQCLQIVLESSKDFESQVSLRSEVKQQEHAFFVKIMRIYEERIKDLKHDLLLLENSVQEMERRGLSPYVQNPSKNYILIVKQKYYQQFKLKIEKINQILRFIEKKKNLKMIKSVADTILRDNFIDKQKQERTLQNLQNIYSNNEANQLQINLGKKQKLDFSYEIDQKEQSTMVPICKVLAKSSNSQNQAYEIFDLLKLMENFNVILNQQLHRSNRRFKQNIEIMSTSNKNLKESIKSMREKICFEEKSDRIRLQKNTLNRYQTIDFLIEVNRDLQSKFQKRSIEVQAKSVQSRSKSCPKVGKEKNTVAQIGRDSQFLQEMREQMNNSFINQCSYLISDRNQEQPYQMIL